ncbi:MAG: hypothetical protein R3E89_11970 [Thiolinea sp.]
MTLAGSFLCIAAVLLLLGDGLLFALGIGLRAAAASLLSVCLSLYIMEYINKQSLALTEARMVYAGAPGQIDLPALRLWNATGSTRLLCYRSCRRC